MNILFFIETGGPGGAERVVLAEAQGLLEMGHHVLVATLREGWFTTQLDELAISRVLLSTRKGFDPLLPIRISKLCKKNNIDIIHSHLLDSNFYCSIASVISKTPHIASEHGDIHHVGLKKFMGLKLRIISLLANKITAVSRFTETALHSHGVSPSKTLVLGNPINCELDNTSPEAFLRHSLCIPQSKWIWAHVANLRPVKDQATLLRGFAQALQVNSDQHLIVVGGGDLRTNLEQLTTSLGIENKVSFLGFRNDVRRILNECNGFILSSISEAQPMSILEAMVAGLLIISTNVGGVPELVQHEENGYLFERGNPSSLSQSIIRATNFPAESRKLAISGQHFVKNNYNLGSILEKLEDLYKGFSP